MSDSSPLGRFGFIKGSIIANQTLWAGGQAVTRWCCWSCFPLLPCLRPWGSDTPLVYFCGCFVTLSLKWPAHNCHLIETMKSEESGSEVRTERGSRQTTKERQTERWSVVEVVTIWIWSQSEAVETQRVPNMSQTQALNWLHVMVFMILWWHICAWAWPFLLV